MTGIVSVYTTFASAAEASRIARILVEERLAACANILGPCRSIYRWNGAVEEAEEFATIFKTAEERGQALVARIGELHSYDLPAAVIWPIAGSSKGYAAWVLGATDPG